jgi:hypothetical protein
MPWRGQRVTYRVVVEDPQSTFTRSNRVYRADAHYDAASIATCGATVRVWYRNDTDEWELDGCYGPQVLHRIAPVAPGYLCECMFSGLLGEMRVHAAAVGLCAACLGATGSDVSCADCPACGGTGRGPTPL